MTIEPALPRVMRAAVYHGAHDVRIESVPTPVRKPGEALLQVLRSGMCGTDATEWKAGPLTFPVARAHAVTGHSGPMIFGHEFIGEVLESDADSGFSIGDIVASGAGIWCGECDRCREGRTNLCQHYYTLGLNTAGGMAEYVSCPIRALVPVPEGMSLDVAGLVQPLAVGLHAARRSGARAGDRVLLIGAGAIGTFVLAGLASLGVTDITVTDFPGRRLERAERVGAARTIPVGDMADKELSTLASQGIDVVIEASGAPGQLDRALSLVRMGGRVLQVGLPSGPQSVNVHSFVMREITVDTTLAHVCDEDLRPAFEILATTGLGEELVDSVNSFEQLAQMLDALSQGQIEGKVLFDPALIHAADSDQERESVA